MKKLNKRNVLEFARKIYEEKDGEIYYRPLCRGVLAKKNGAVVGCILGDMYEEFVGKPVARPLTKGEIKDRNLVKNVLETNSKYWITKTIKSGMMPLIREWQIIQALMNIATIKHDSSWLNSANVRLILRKLPNINDSIRGETETARIRRARLVRAKLDEMAEHLE